MTEKELDGLEKVWAGYVTGKGADVLRLIAEYRAERELLKKYGDHMVTCTVRQWNDLTEVCDCGWRKLTFD